MAKKIIPAQPATVEQEFNPEDLRAKIESILYCIPDGVAVEKLGERLGLSQHGKVKAVLLQMQQEYASKRGIQVVNENNIWKFKVPDEHIQIVKDVAEPEFDKSVVETLAYIAWRGGSRQCDVVRVRSNKAYNHIKLLIEKGFIESSKAGLSKWLEPTKKFYEYFKLQQGQKLDAGIGEKTPVDVQRAIEAGMKALFG
jgi:segregation and condensation protein B